MLFKYKDQHENIITETLLRLLPFIKMYVKKQKTKTE